MKRPPFAFRSFLLAACTAAKRWVTYLRGRQAARASWRPLALQWRKRNHRLANTQQGRAPAASIFSFPQFHLHLATHQSGQNPGSRRSQLTSPMHVTQVHQPVNQQTSFRYTSNNTVWTRKSLPALLRQTYTLLRFIETRYRHSSPMEPTLGSSASSSRPNALSQPIGLASRSSLQLMYKQIDLFSHHQKQTHTQTLARKSKNHQQTQLYYSTLTRHLDDQARVVPRDSNRPANQVPREELVWRRDRRPQPEV